MQQTFFKRQLFAFDAISGCIHRRGLKRRITRWLLVIPHELELWILVQEPEILLRSLMLIVTIYNANAAAVVAHNKTKQKNNKRISVFLF